MIKIKIPATSANLGAGFDSLGLAVNLYNYVYLEQSPTLSIRTLDAVPIPCGAENLVYMAAQTLYERCGKKLDGLLIKQKNDIPMTRGLGSSSACIVAGLVGANHLLGKPLSIDDLVNLAAEMEGHPDNTTPALLGGIVTSVYDGKQVHWVKQEVSTDLHFYAIIPDFELKTEVARAALPKTISFGDAVFNLSRAALFSSSLLQGKYENLRIATQDHLHQPYRLNMIRGGKEIIEAAEQFGAYGVYVSGGGPTIMAIVDKDRYFFAMNLRERLDELGFSSYQILQLHIDNHGTQVYGDTV